MLRNYSPGRVRLTSLRLVYPVGPGFRVLNVRAYLLSQTGGVIALVFRKPGRYHFGEPRIGYVKDGQAWLEANSTRTGT